MKGVRGTGCSGSIAAGLARGIGGGLARGIACRVAWPSDARAPCVAAFRRYHEIVTPVYVERQSGKNGPYKFLQLGACPTLSVNQRCAAASMSIFMDANDEQEIEDATRTAEEGTRRPDFIPIRVADVICAKRLEFDGDILCELVSPFEGVEHVVIRMPPAVAARFSQQLRKLTEGAPRASRQSRKTRGDVGSE